MTNATKVGDTISATVEPSNATGLTYAWFMGDAATQVETAIEGATSSSFSVTKDYVGKYLKVVVSGDNSSSASATTTAAVVEDSSAKIAIASAKQIGASKIEVTFNKAVSTSGWDITVSRGTTVQANPTIVLDDTATKATITLGTAISAAEYTVKIANKTDATENAESKFNGEVAVLKSIDFVGDQLILTSSDMKTAAVNISGVNQFEEQVALSGALTVYTTKGEANYSQADKKIVITCGASIFFTTGEQVTVTAVYNNGNVPLQVSKALTVSNVATLTKFELGEVATTRTSLKGKKLNLTNLSTDTYYFPVKVAEDQYGNKLTAKELDKMMVKGAADASKNLYITPALADGAYAYVTGFTTLDDGTIAMNISKGTLNSPGKAIFSITGVSGFQGTQELDILDDPYIAELSVSAPSLYVGQEVEITVSAKDQDGEALNLYDVGAEVATTGKTFKFGDTNHLTKGSSSITFSDGAATLKVKKNTSKKTITFLYTPGTKDQTIVTVQSATPTVSNLTWTVAGETTPAGIQGLAEGMKTTFVKGNSDVQALGNNTKIVFLDSSGAAMGTTNAANAAKYPQYAGDEETDVPTGTADRFYYTVSAPTNDCITVGAATGNVDQNAKTGTSNVTITLYQTKTVNGAVKAVALGEKVIKFTVADSTYKSYKASLAAGSELLYVNAKSADESGFTVVGVDKDGLEVGVSDYTVTVDSDLKVVGQKVSGAVSGISKAGTAVATIWDVIDGTKQAVATVDVPYDVAAPAPQKEATKKGTKFVTDTEFEGVTGVAINSDGTVGITNAKGTYVAMILDQYNLPMGNVNWALDGSALKAGNVVDGKQHVITGTSAKVAGSWTIQGSAITITAPVDNSKKLASAKWTSGTNTATITAGTAANDMGKFSLYDNEGTQIAAAFSKVDVKITNAQSEDKTDFFTVAAATNDIQINNKANTPVGIYEVTFTAKASESATLKGSVTASQKLTVNVVSILTGHAVTFNKMTAQPAANATIATIATPATLPAGTKFYLQKADGTAVANGELVNDNGNLKVGATAPDVKAGTGYRIYVESANPGTASSDAQAMIGSTTDASAYKEGATVTNSGLAWTISGAKDQYGDLIDFSASNPGNIDTNVTLTVSNTASAGTVTITFGGAWGTTDASPGTINVTDIYNNMKAAISRGATTSAANVGAADITGITITAIA